MKQRGLRFLVKRSIDVAAASSLLVASSPVMAVTGGAVWFSMGRPLIFTQTRIGRGDRPFKIFKFRSMAHPKNPDAPEPDADRITRVGRFIRATSLDELPQLVNVLRGDMSLVGPRPLLVRYLPRYSSTQRKRHDVLPGVTGWAQVNGRNASTWDRKFADDVWYVDNWSLRLDLEILFRTAATVLKREGVSADAHVTMPEFMGPAGAV